MRIGPRKALAGIVAGLLALASGNHAAAQNVPAYPGQAVAGYNDGPVASERGDVIDDLRRRLDMYEAELRTLKAHQQQQQQSPGGVQATPAAYDVMNSSAAADANANACMPKEVPIITEPSKIKVGAKMFFDNVGITQSPSNVLATGKPKEFDYTGLTYLRLYTEGWLYENVDYKFEIECASNAIAPALGTPSVSNPSAGQLHVEPDLRDDSA